MKKINVCRTHKKILYPFELIRYDGNTQTDMYLHKHTRSTIEWPYEFQDAEAPSNATWKVWTTFKSWLFKERTLFLNDIDLNPLSLWSQDPQQLCLLKRIKNGFEKHEIAGEFSHAYKRIEILPDIDVSTFNPVFVRVTKKGVVSRVHPPISQLQQTSEALKIIQRTKIIDSQTNTAITENTAVICVDSAVKGSKLAIYTIVSDN